MGPQAAGRDVRLAARPADEGPLVVVQPLVQLEVDVLGEPAGALVAGVGLLARVQPHVGLQVGRRAEPLAALVARMGLLAWRMIENNANCYSQFIVRFC